MVQRLHFLGGRRAHASRAQTGSRSALRLRTVAAVIDTLGLSRLIFLRGNTIRHALDRIGVMRILAARRLVACLFELNQLGSHLGTGDRRVRLGERDNRGSERSSNHGDLNERFHDDLPPVFVCLSSRRTMRSSLTTGV